MSLHTAHATIHTSLGEITVELYGNHAPKTVKNFVDLANGDQEWTDPRSGQKRTDSLYVGSIFHRIIPNFMIQGGCPLGTGTGGPGYQFADEISSELSFSSPYILAMANSGPATNGSQFFITVTDTSWLFGKHTIFGAVTDKASQEIVDKIASVQTGRQDKPVVDVTINSITISA